MKRRLFDDFLKSLGFVPYQLIDPPFTNSRGCRQVRLNNADDLHPAFDRFSHEQVLRFVNDNLATVSLYNPKTFSGFRDFMLSLENFDNRSKWYYFCVAGMSRKSKRINADVCLAWLKSDTKKRMRFLPRLNDNDVLMLILKLSAGDTSAVSTVAGAMTREMQEIVKTFNKFVARYDNEIQTQTPLA